MIRVYPDIYSIRLGNGLRIDAQQRLEVFGDLLDFGAFNPLDFASFAFPMNSLDGGTFASPSAASNDLGALNQNDYASFAFPMNTLDYQTFASPSSTTTDLGTF